MNESRPTGALTIYANCGHRFARSPARMMLALVVLTGAAFFYGVGSVATAQEAIVCGAPAFDAGTERATFIWMDCQAGGKLHIRVTGGGIKTSTVYKATIASTNGFSLVQPISLESSDVLEVAADVLSYEFKVWNVGYDGLDFAVASGTCFIPAGPLNLPVYLGAGKVPLPASNTDLSTGDVCGTAATVPTDPPPPGTTSFAFQDVSLSAGLGGFRMESWGAAWADINGDFYPDLFMSDHRVPGRFYQNNGDGTFSNKSSYVDKSNAFYNTTRDTHAATWADFDNDGDQDLGIAVGAVGSLGSMLVNDAGRLTDKRNALGLNIGVGGEQRMPVFFDYNNDGLLDVKVINFKETSSKDTLFRQNPNHTFTQVYNSAGLRCINSDWAQFTDINGSGQLEMLCGDRNGNFPVAAYDYSTGYGIQLGISPTDLVNDAIAADLNNDLRPDLLAIRGRLRIDQIHKSGDQSAEVHALINYSGKRTYTIKTFGTLDFAVNPAGTKNWLWPGKDADGVLNDIYIGAGGYHPASANLSLNPWNSANHGLQNPGTTDGLFAGFDNKTGEWTLVFNTTRQYSYAYLAITSTAPITGVSGSGYEAGNVPITPKYLLNAGGYFVDATQGNGFVPELCVSGVAGDFDNDMDLDLYFACRDGASNLENVFYENLGSGIFTRLASASGAEGITGAALGGNAGNSENVVTVDYDVDGFLDLLVTNGLNMAPKGIGGDEQLFRNLGNGNHWVELDLVGTQSNRDGMGAKITVTAGEVTQYREQNGGYHRWAQNHPRIHVGLGDNQVISEIKIRWPSGRIDKFTNVSADSLYRVTEGQGITAVISRTN